MTAMPWVKLYTDILNDKKLMRAAREGAKHLVVLPWLLAFAMREGDHGRLTVAGSPADPADIAHDLPGVKPAHVADCISALERIGVLVRDDDEALRFARWEERAKGKPSDEPERVLERVQRHRQKRRAGDRNAERNAPETPYTPSDVTPGNAPCNALRNAQDRDREEEEEGEERELPPTAPLARAGSRVSEAVGRDLAERFYRAVRERLGVDSANAFLAEAAGALDGLHGPALTPALLTTALGDYLANGESQQPNLRRFRGYLRGVIPSESARPPDAPAARNGRRRAETRAETKTPDYGEGTTSLDDVRWT